MSDLPDNPAERDDAGNDGAQDSSQALESEDGLESFFLDPGEVLDVVEQGAREHLEWLHRFHRCVLCGEKPPRDVISDQSRFLCAFGSWADMHHRDRLVTQPAFQALLNMHDAMHDDASFLAQKVAEGKTVSANEYDMLSSKVLTFYEHARRIERAFNSARSDLDPLTGLYNRQVMMAEVARERERALRTDTPCCIALADIDHFKSINDSFGHSVGDQVLQVCATRILEGLRPYDTVFRYGGEEFLICLPNADLARAEAILERLRSEIAAVPVTVIPPEQGTQGAPSEVPVTSSFGITMFEDAVSLTESIERADQGLYKAKKA